MPADAFFISNNKYSSLARVHLCPLAARVALDVAAPQELAVTLPDPRVLVRVVPSPAAHQITAANVLHHSLVAHSPLCAQTARDRVSLAVVRGFVYVNQVRIHGFAVREGFFDFEEFGALVSAGFDGLHVQGLGILLLENVAELAELGECGPAGSGGARARDAVTLAFQPHVLLQHLSPNLVIVQVHKCPGVLFDFSGVNEDFGEAQAVADVCRAAPPLPAIVFPIEALLLLVTAAVAQIALCTSCCYGMSHSCCDDGVGKCCLLTAHFQLFAEDGPLPERRAVPAAVFELELALVDAHLDPLSDDDNGIGATLTDYPLSGSQTGDLVTDYART